MILFHATVALASMEIISVLKYRLSSSVFGVHPAHALHSLACLSSRPSILTATGQSSQPLRPGPSTTCHTSDSLVPRGGRFASLHRGPKFAMCSIRLRIHNSLKYLSQRNQSHATIGTNEVSSCTSPSKLHIFSILTLTDHTNPDFQHLEFQPNPSTLQHESKFNSVWLHNLRFFVTEDLPVHPPILLRRSEAFCIDDLLILEADANTCVLNCCLRARAAKPHASWSRARSTTTPACNNIRVPLPKFSLEQHLFVCQFQGFGINHVSNEFSDGFRHMLKTFGSKAQVTRSSFAGELDLHDFNPLWTE